jgi:hypothetical protein
MISIILFILMVVITFFIGFLIALPLILIITWVQRTRLKRNIVKLIKKGDYKLKDERERQERIEGLDIDARTVTGDNVREHVFEGKRTIMELERKYQGQKSIPDVHDRETRESKPVTTYIERKPISPNRQVESRTKLHKPTII